ncbi:MAG: adenosylcobinamide-GDP ribazoletransferase [Candidatus Omnitrophota bacterium]
MTSFFLALQFLTTLSLKIEGFSGRRIAWSLVYFPVVGCLLAALLIGLNSLLIILGISQVVTNIILVIFLIILTGGMHLDGLADTTDALLSGKEKKEMLEIMRDPHVGVMGVLSLISIMLLKVVLLSSVSIFFKPIALFLMCILSRWSVVLIMYLFPYAREEGKAKLFIQGLTFKIFATSLAITATFSFVVWDLPGLLVFLIIAGCVYLGNKVISKKLGGVTGDTLGATMELTEVTVLFIVCIMQRMING